MFLLDLLNRKIPYNNPIQESYIEQFRIINSWAASVLGEGGLKRSVRKV